jgi:chromosomal replication initiator protein
MRMKNRKKLEEAIGLINCVQEFLSKLLDNVDIDDDNISVGNFMFDSPLDSKKTFQNFIEGDNNKVARTIGLSIVENPGQVTNNPCLIYGPSGCGKTHLINAIGMACKEKYPKKQVMYASARELQRQYTYSVRKNLMDDFINYYQSIDVLIVDDIQEWMNAPKTLEAFILIFNHLISNGKQVILASDRAPVKLQGMKKQILSRLVSGLVIEMEKPTMQLCKDILNAKCGQEDLKIPVEVTEYIANTVNDNVFKLEGVVNSLKAYSLVNHVNIDVELVKRVIIGKHLFG